MGILTTKQGKTHAKRKIILPVVTAMLALTLTACGNATATTTDGFTSAAEGLGLQTQDITEDVNTELSSYSDSATVSNVESCVVAYDDSESYEVYFYDFSSEDDATSFYNGAETAINSVVESGSSHSGSSVSVGNKNSIKQTVDGTYYAVTRVDDTAVVSVTDEANKDGVDKLFDAIGY